MVAAVVAIRSEFHKAFVVYAELRFAAFHLAERAKHDATCYEMLCEIVNRCIYREILGRDKRSIFCQNKLNNNTN